MDYFVNVKDLNQLRLILTIIWGKIRNMGLRIVLTDNIPVDFRQKYIDNENELRRITSLQIVGIDDLNRRNNRYCLIYKDNYLIGSILCYRISSEVILNFLFVDRQYRRRNIGKLLTAMIIKDQIKIHPKTTKIVTDPSNDIACKILKGFNFRPERN